MQYGPLWHTPWTFEFKKKEFFLVCMHTQQMPFLLWRKEILMRIKIFCFVLPDYSVCVVYIEILYYCAVGICNWVQFSIVCVFNYSISDECMHAWTFWCAEIYYGQTTDNMWGEVFRYQFLYFVLLYASSVMFGIIHTTQLLLCVSSSRLK